LEFLLVAEWQAEMQSTWAFSNEGKRVEGFQALTRRFGSKTPTITESQRAYRCHAD
jgi:hypothetical protein